MTPEQFVYWLQGYMEMANPSSLNMRETRIIKDHLALVFDKKTPERGGNGGLDLNLMYSFPGQSSPLRVDENGLDKKFCSSSDQSYSTTPICLNLDSSNTLPKKEKSNDKKPKTPQVKC
jgi:hypothetical protein